MAARRWLWWLGALCAAAARELDPAACGARFDVQRDKIIRTEESRDMGARYLSELDVGARAECLRLCCETEACDVFVYEEKGPGSCYLFECGPPEDFRCKFTAHGNFSSGVLALSRRLAELQDQERLALAELRSGSTQAPTTPRAPPPAPPAARPAPAPASPAPPDLLLTPGRCSRYQFECRRGGECVAVYNACDGVPQCADGSDEAPELGCPPPPAPAPAAPAAPPAPRPRQETQERSGASDGPEREAPAAAAAVASGAGAERDRWPHRLAQAQPQHRYPEAAAEAAEAAEAAAPHIFSHTGGLLREDAAFEPAPWPRRARPQRPEAGWWREAPRAWPVPPAPAPMFQEAMEYAGGAREATLRDSPKKAPPAPPAAPTAPAAPAPAAPAAPAPPPAAPTAHTAPAPPPPSPHHKPHKEKAAGAAARVADAGLSERPPAALLLLVLGVGMSLALAALGARRARSRRRRPRARAHDADYLVNGMYL